MTPAVIGFRRMRVPRKAVVLFLVLCCGVELIVGQVQPVPLRPPGTSQYCREYNLGTLRASEQCLKERPPTRHALWENSVPGPGACANAAYCMCDIDAENYVRGTVARQYCEFLLQDTPDNWKYPFRGRHPNPDPARTIQQELNYRCSSFTYCIAFMNNPPFPGGDVQQGHGLAVPDHQGGRQNWFRQIFRFSTFNDYNRGYSTHYEIEYVRNTFRERFNEETRKQITNRLQFTDRTISQEGISFCIAGRHLKKSALTSMDSLRGFLPLIERSFDIGNHIDPEDSNQMNRFDLTEEHKNFFSQLVPASDYYYQTDADDQIRSWNFNNARGIPRHEYEDVFMGFRALELRLFDPNFSGRHDPINKNRDLPLHEGFKTRPAHPDYQPGPNCRNPYRVQATTIEANGKSLHNYLHIKVFSEDVGNPTGQNCPTGKMRFLMLEIRDENGYPVGQFTDEIPCDKDEATLNSELKCPGNADCRRWTGTKANQVPCMIAHPESTVHPSIFMVSASEALNGGGGGGGSINNAGGGAGGNPNVNQGQGAGGGGGFCRDSKVARNARPRVEYPVRTEYFTEIHATWRFAQMNNRWTKELHFATLIVEEETPIQYYTGRQTLWQGPDSPDEWACAQFKRPVERIDWRWEPLNCPPLDPFCNRVRICEGPNPGGYDLRWVSIWDPNRNPPQWIGLFTCCTRKRNHNYNCDEFCDYGKTQARRNEKNDELIPREIFVDRDACYRWAPFRSTYSRGGLYQLALLNRCVDENENTNRPYGYSARYSVLKPTFRTMGGWDHLQKRYIPPDNINCHVDLTSGDLYDFDSSQFGQFPVRTSLLDFLDNAYRLRQTSRYQTAPAIRPPPYPLPPANNPYHDPAHLLWHREYNWCDGTQFRGLGRVPNTYELSDWHSIGVSWSQNTPDMDQMLQFTYFGRTPQSAARKMFRSAHQDPVVLKAEFPDNPLREYFGSEHILCPSPAFPIETGTGTPRCPEREINQDLQRAFGPEQNQTLQQMGDRSRCPCPFIPTTAPPELQTKTDLEIDGRQLHVINMLFAWMVLVPLAFFVARFYKETFSKVFFLQEFWWYTIHVLSLLTVLLFTFGGIYGMRLKRNADYVVVWTNATSVHIYTAYVLIGLFIFHLCIGPFRLYNPELRMIQIALHWGIGWVEYSLAIVVTLSATAIPSGMMNCTAFGVYCGFIGFQIVMTVGMELHMRFVVDKLLALDPPREYMPPPMMRLFHRDAPYSKCRIVILIVFITGCFTFYGLMHTFIHLDGGETGCFQPKAANSSRS